MDLRATSQVRRFNRTVTQRVGALSDGYLARGRPLAASRVLWEIGEGDVAVKALRTRLDLDSGYLSRLLRVLEAEGLVSVQSDQKDRRVRIARLSEAGRAERDVLDRASDELAWSLIEPLDGEQRARVLEAMGVVERLLTAALVSVTIDEASSDEVRFCFESYFAELDARFETGFDSERSISADAHELTEPEGLVLVARLRDEPIGCAALKLHGDEPAEIKRMWVAPAARGLGLGRRLLRELEAAARRRGATHVRLETNHVLTEAINLYRSTGYREVSAFNDERYAHHWFEKRLD